MKNYFRALLATACLATASFAAQAQASPPAAAADTTRLVLSPSLVNPVNLQSYEAFRAAVQPLIQQMANKKIVAMGEGTHGTAEFYLLRFWLTRILVEEHGFAQVALENGYGDAYRLNEALQHAAVQDLKPLMKQHLSAIWQNQETEQLLAWMQRYNRGRGRKVALGGIDAMFSSTDARLLRDILAKTHHPELRALTTQLVKCAAFNDSVAFRFSDRTMKLNRKAWLANGWQGYQAADQLAKALQTTRVPQQQRAVLAGAAQNIKQAFDVFYQAKVNKRESSRDSSMAEMTKFLVRNSGKVIIWAHDAHVARRAAFGGDNNGGGTGSFLERMFPGQYFVVGTSTAAGTFAATADSYTSVRSVMAPCQLEKPSAGSWEDVLSRVPAPAFYFNTRALGAQDVPRPHRLVGQTPDSQKQYATYKLADAYDALFFVRQTTAATPLR